MNKGLEALESLDKLEECAYAMKDLPMSNWIDLANSEVELDLKIMNWVETIKFELSKGQQALLELKQIKEAEPSEAMESLERIDKEYATIENEDFKICFNTIKQALLNAQELKKENKELIKKADCCLWKDCNKISQENTKLKKAIEIIKKHFIIKLEEETDLNGNVWGRLVSIQSKEDEGTWDTTACANIVNCKEDFDLLEEVLENE